MKTCDNCHSPEVLIELPVTCFACGGEGIFAEKTCQNCNGTGESTLCFCDEFCKNKYEQPTENKEGRWK